MGSSIPCPTSQTIYVRAEFLNSCYGISAIDLVVHELPNIETQEEILYCLNDFPQTITLTGGVIDDLPNNYLYQWSTGETTTEIQVNQPGSYSVTVTNTDGCSKQRTVTVVPSNIATIEDVQVTDASDNNTITVIVSGEGDYEYALDSELRTIPGQQCLRRMYPSDSMRYSSGTRTNAAWSVRSSLS